MAEIPLVVNSIDKFCIFSELVSVFESSNCNPQVFGSDNISLILVLSAWNSQRSDRINCIHRNVAPPLIGRSRQQCQTVSSSVNQWVLPSGCILFTKTIQVFAHTTNFINPLFGHRHLSQSITRLHCNSKGSLSSAKSL